MILVETSQCFYLLESPNAETQDEESQLLPLLCGDVLDGDQHRPQVGVSGVKVERLGAFQRRPMEIEELNKKAERSRLP